MSALPVRRAKTPSSSSALAAHVVAVRMRAITVGLVAVAAMAVWATTATGPLMSILRALDTLLAAPTASTYPQLGQW